MDAPLYPPAAAYVPPAIVPTPMSTADTSIARLLADPAAKAIVLGAIPGFEARVGSEQMRPHLDNFSLRSLVQFGVFKASDLDRVDAQLAALPAGAAR